MTECILYILVPGISFLLITLFRKKLNAPRPYEVYGFEPAIPKDTKGNSFPSRHVFSIFMIAMTYSYSALFQDDIKLIVSIFAMGVVLAIIRVLGGVHFLKDVMAGAISGIVLGYVGFYLLGGIF